MPKKLLAPAVAFLAGLVVWVGFIVQHEAGGTVDVASPWLGVLLCALAGALVVVADIRCRKVGGPRVGRIVRTVLLLGLSAITWWRVGVWPALVLAAAAVVIVVLALAARSGGAPGEGGGAATA